MRELPPGWVETTIGEIGDYLNGRGFKKSEWSSSGRPIIRIQNLTGSGSAFNYYAGEAEEPHIARDGDLLISWAATLGVYVWRGPEAVINQHIFKVMSFIDPRFHRYLVLSLLAALGRETHGSGMVHITRGRFESLAARLPPLAEQRRIVAAIEEQFSRLDAAEAGLERAERRLGAQSNAALESAFRSLPIVDLGTVASDIRYGTSTKCSYVPSGLPVLRIPNVAKGRIDLSDLKYADSSVDLSSAVVEPGDLLIVRTNGSRNLIGRAAPVVFSGEPTSFASYLIRVRLDPTKADARFMSLVLSSPNQRATIEARAATTAGQYNLNIPSLRSLSVPAIGLEDQRRIVAELEQQLSVIDSLRAAVESAQKRSAALRRAILERAFRGELVSQDPADEPASVLLERIRTGRAAEPPRKRGAVRSSR